jgi:phage terminase large subunit-like protein
MMGRRFGKNEVGSACVIDYTTQPEEYSFGSDENPITWWVGPTYRQAYLYGFQTVKEKLPDVLIDESNTRGSEWGPSRITLTTGEEIEFLSFGNPSGLQGAGVDLIVGDEWAYSDQSLWDNDLRPMLMDSGGGAVLISKPLGENHFYESYKQGEADNYPEWASFHATAYENPFIPDSEVDKAKRTTPEGTFRQEYLADPQAGGTLLTLDMLSYESWEKLTEIDNWNWHVAVDIGVTMDKQKARENDSDFWACAIVASHPMKQEVYLVQVLRERGQTPAQAADWLETVMGQVPTNNVYIEAVAAQEWFLNEARKKNLNPSPVTHDRPKEERITFLSVPFNNGNVKLIDWDDHPENDFDWSTFRTEWAGFPNSDHDDQLDALEMALRFIDFGQGQSLMSADPYGRDDDE